MRVFPQLSSGAIIQYPYTFGIRQRAAVNKCADGSRLWYPDLASSTRYWEIRQSALNELEWQKLESFFAASEGKLNPFVFLDPTDNLLTAAGSLSDTAWAREYGLLDAGAVDGPEGLNGGRRLDNPSPVARKWSQSLELPGSYQYCFSIWVRAELPVEGWIAIEGDGSAAERRLGITPEWSRFSVSAHLSSGVDLVAVWLEIPTAAVVEVFGPQLEAQPVMSDYKTTVERGGIYRTARFLDDEIVQKTQGDGSHDAVVRIVSREEN